MSEWSMKRFWSAAEVVAAPEGYAIQLDGRGVKTPAKTPLEVPTRSLAEAIADEWRAQTDVVDPRTMPMTRLANSALDKVRPQHDDVARYLAEYGGSDLLCYRADGPEELVARQAMAWDPMISWAQDKIDSAFSIQTGLMPIAQSDTTKDRILAETRRFSDFELAGFHDLVTLTGSWLLGFAISQNHLTPDEAWDKSRIDEDWQIEQWGDDEEASALAAAKHEDLLKASAFFHASRVDHA